MNIHQSSSIIVEMKYPDRYGLDVDKYRYETYIENRRYIETNASIQLSNLIDVFRSEKTNGTRQLQMKHLESNEMWKLVTYQTWTGPRW